MSTTTIGRPKKDNVMNRLLATIISAAVATGMLTTAHAQPASAGSVASSDAGASAGQDALAKSSHFFRKLSPEDKQLTRTVRRKVAQLKGVDTTEVSIIAREGIVRLTGTVQDNDQLQKVTEAVQGTAGVKSVVNGLTLRPRM